MQKPSLDDDSTDGSAGAWSEERRRLLHELEQRDALLAVADEHMEAEIDKMHDQLARQHSRQVTEEVKVLICILHVLIGSQKGLSVYLKQ